MLTRSERGLLCRARLILDQWYLLHTNSVAIGRLEGLADSGLADKEIEACRKLVEEADLMCACRLARVAIRPTCA